MIRKFPGKRGRPFRREAERRPLHRNAAASDIEKLAKRFPRILRHDTPYENAIRIIREGILSHELAKRAKREIPMGRGAYQKPDEVSVWDSARFAEIVGADKTETAVAILKVRTLSDEVAFFAYVPKQRIREAKHVTPDIHESVVKRRIHPKEIFAIKLGNGIPEEAKREIIAEAKRKGILVYDDDGKLIQ